MVFLVEGSAHVNGVLESFGVSELLGGGLRGDGVFVLDAALQFVDVIVQTGDGGIEGGQDSVVFIDGFVVDLDGIVFNFGGVVQSGLEVFFQLFEEGFELVNNVVTNTVLEVGLGEEDGDDGSEGVNLVSLDHLGEHQVDVAGELDETNSLGGEVSQDGVSTLDGIESGLELVVNQSVVSVVFSESLSSQTREDILDGSNVVFGLL